MRSLLADIAKRYGFSGQGHAGKALAHAGKPVALVQRGVQPAVILGSHHDAVPGAVEVHVQRLRGTVART